MLSVAPPMAVQATVEFGDITARHGLPACLVDAEEFLHVGEGDALNVGLFLAADIDCGVALDGRDTAAGGGDTGWQAAIGYRDVGLDRVAAVATG